uniref:Uncharacterized protein n=1 Tax=Hyaloperonospora arabidopsidis (strain Emoy2) TaxID=559515 RepID=M4BK70_HYAAE
MLLTTGDPSVNNMKELVRQTTMTKAITKILKATDVLGGISVREKHGFSLFNLTNTRTTTSNIPFKVYAVGKFAYNITDVSSTIITPATASFERRWLYCSRISSM